MPKRVVVFAAIGAVALAVAGYLAFVKINELQDEVARLDRELDATHNELADARARAVAADSAASAATAQAGAAEQRATEAQIRADLAADKAAEAEQAARLATTDREEALRVAREAEQARLAAEADSAAAQAEAEEARGVAIAAREEARLAREEAENIRRQREIELNRMQEALSTIVETRRTAIGIVLNLGSDRIQFEFDKAELRAKERELLARIAGVLIATADQGYAIQVFGHTDDVGSEEYNLGLSERRAAAVRDYLVESGVDADIITMRGMGKSMPLIADTTEEARAKNRRVEIAVIDTMVEYRTP